MRSGELFAGVGGLGMAVDEVFGSSPAWFAEFDAAPSKVLAYRHPGIPNYGDVTKLIAPEKVQILAGGFPCQDVSLAGRRKGMKDGTRSGLWSEYARIIDEVRPDWVVIENVRGLISARADSEVEPCPWCVGDGDDEYHLRALDAVLADLTALGFDATWTHIRASDVGAPHGRYRFFILAWPSENTSGSGSGGWAEGQEPSRRDDATLGSDQGRDGGRTDSRLKLLSTPDTVPEAPNSGSNSHKAGNIVGLGNQVMSLLPTHVAQPSGNTPEEHLRKTPGRTVVTDLAIMAENGLIGSGGRLLPTPTVGNATGGNSQRGGDRADEKLLPGLVRDHATDWGPYADAITRWESIIDRPSPAPVRMDGRNGKARLNPELTEWMMGWPAGYVTDPEIGLSRAEQLKACGNGVVPQQAAAALRELLSRPGVPGIREEVTA